GELLGVVHRDVSLQNILVGVDGVARLLDFGVARASERISSTSVGQIKGKLSYMAPEQIRSGDVDRRTDVYSAAVVFWELLTGRKLFQGVNEGATVQNILITPVTRPSALRSMVPPELDAIVMRGLARAPAERYPTALAMADAIEHAGVLANTHDIGRWVRE